MMGCNCGCHTGVSRHVGPCACQRETWVDVVSLKNSKNLHNEGVSPEELARYFHQEYERLAPSFGYKTREASAVPWENVPEDNRRLMEAVAESIILQFFPKEPKTYRKIVKGE